MNRKHTLILLAITLTFSCGTKRETQEPNSIVPTSTALVEEKVIQKDSLVTTRVENGVNFFDYNLRRWNGMTWDEYIISGNPDTAITLHTYKILTSDDEPDFMEWAAYTNLYENTKTVKSIIKSKFSNENPTQLIIQGIDKINADFLQYAIKEVESEIEQYGLSDGPYFSFVENHGKLPIEVPNEPSEQETIWNRIHKKAEELKKGKIELSSPDDIDTNFMEFFNRFLSDSTFQFNHVNAEVLAAVGFCETTKILTQDNWEFIGFDYEEGFADPRYKHLIINEENTFYLESTLIEIGVILQIGFQRIEGDWQIVLYDLNLC